MTTPPKLNPFWNLQIYDQSGQRVTQIDYTPNEPPTVHGDMNAIIDALPSITSLTRFFTDPDEQARACYNAYRQAWETTYDSTCPTWDELLAMPHKAALVAIWRKTAQAAATTDSTLN